MTDHDSSQSQQDPSAEVSSSPEHQPPVMDDATRAVLLPKPWESALSGYTPPAGRRDELPRRRSGRFDLAPDTTLYTHLIGMGGRNLLAENASIDPATLIRSKPESLAGIIKDYETSGLQRMLKALRALPDNESPAVTSNEEESADKGRPYLTDGESSTGDIG